MAGTHCEQRQRTNLLIKKAKTTIFLTWEDYLKQMFAVDRLAGHRQKIRLQPSDMADEIKYEGRDCFQVRLIR